jgi:hypothetical protein
MDWSIISSGRGWEGPPLKEQRELPHNRRKGTWGTRLRALHCIAWIPCEPTTHSRSCDLVGQLQSLRSPHRQSIYPPHGCFVPISLIISTVDTHDLNGIIRLCIIGCGFRQGNERPQKRLVDVLTREQLTMSELACLPTLPCGLRSHTRLEEATLECAFWFVKSIALLADDCNLLFWKTSEPIDRIPPWHLYAFTSCFTCTFQHY